MFWNKSGAFIQRRIGTGETQYVDWEVSLSSRLDEAGHRRLDTLHLACSRHPLGAPDAGRTDDADLRFAVRAKAGRGRTTTDRLLCLRISAQAVELWIAVAGPVARSGPGPRRLEQPALEAPRPEDAILVDGGTIVLDGPVDVGRG
jgi:hypothetical protein